ncbi:hypothetical protein [Aureibacillus halotolerans]|uniref:Uncharacterized protein n=1 Tax=Aureibacillus halotolerans TaxID=1508390 RepID=A0A4R6TT66_9BACI|nr:hypothetical protein [Aureibacillus halotolerans]TDQ33791.1 hypothetical protein EV213_12823 [Aureibacillus halotolerans]
MARKNHVGVYEIGFRSSGHYSLTGATLISGVQHKTVNDESFTSTVTAKLTAEYEGKTYKIQSTGYCGLNYKDGDCFSFAFSLEDEPVRKDGIVRLTMTGLYENVWRER